MINNNLQGKETRDVKIVSSENINNLNTSTANTKKQKIIILSILASILLITALSLILTLSLKKSKKRPKGLNTETINILPPLVLNASSGNHTHTIIFLPGLTNTPEDFEIVFTDWLNYNKKNDTTIVILRSPLVYVSYFESTNYSWFDIYDFPLQNNSNYNFKDLKHSAKILEEVIKNEANALGGKYENIIIGGHSQGACISLYQGYKTNKKLGGVISLSGILPPLDVSQDKNDFNVYFGYGDQDYIILPSFFNESIQRIKDFDGFNLHIYKNHQHHVIMDEIEDIDVFLNKIMK